MSSAFNVSYGRSAGGVIIISRLYNGPIAVNVSKFRRVSSYSSLETAIHNIKPELRIGRSEFWHSHINMVHLGARHKKFCRYDLCLPDSLSIAVAASPAAPVRIGSSHHRHASLTSCLRLSCTVHNLPYSLHRHSRIPTAFRFD